jgi:hypothetical protein
MNYLEFSQKIKTKYPQYSDLDDKTLAEKMVSKYPQYKDVTFDNQPAVEPVKSDLSKIIQDPIGAINPLNHIPRIIETAKNLPSSIAKNLNPVNIVKGGYEVGRAAGAAVTGDFQPTGEIISGIAKDYGEKYGSIDKIKDTMKTDPIRPLMDIFGIASLSKIGGTVAGKAKFAAKSALTPDINSSLTRAIKPSISNKTFIRDIDPVSNAVFKNALEKNMPIESIDDFGKSLDDIMVKTWDTYENILKKGQEKQVIQKQVTSKKVVTPAKPNDFVSEWEIPNQPVTKEVTHNVNVLENAIDGNKISKAIDETLKNRVRPISPTLEKEIQNQSDFYRGRNLTIREADQALHEVNNDLKSFYVQKYGKAMESFNDPATRHLVNEAKALRESIDERLSQLTGEDGKTFRTLWGKMANVRNAVQDRIIVNQRLQPMSLQETINKPFAIARGVGGILTGNAPAIMESAAQFGASRAIKTLNSTNGLIKSAFEKFRNSQKSNIPFKQRTIDLGKKSVIPAVSIGSMIDNSNQTSLSSFLKNQ